ncbi:enhancer of mRNA-decapping protein 3 isoform X2 [Anabrus simplex]|uniref:enhancer of mRNA-decapping protein 3 isoform X2 n=1 Tax=Anabrus simplex TaxID=316456 RepID=UPI0034DD0750
MSGQWIGFTVSVNCGETLGTYQGQIIHVDSSGQTITLKKAFRNGIPDPSQEVVLCARDIQNLKIIDTASEEGYSKNTASTVAVTKPVAKRPNRSVSESLAAVRYSLRESPRKPVEDPGPRTSTSQSQLGEGNRTPSKKDRQRHKWSEKDEACFGTPIDNIIHHEFDFEKNLALFNKQAVYEEINASQRPDLVRQTDINRRGVQNYRHDQNVLASAPAMYRQVVVPAPGSKEYVTDDGLVIPSITCELRRQLIEMAERRGLSHERQSELMGRAATEMALQLLGGAHRLNPHNVHQWPTVVALCGSHRQGSFGINCARQLASHGVNTIIYLVDPTCLSPILMNEIALYRLTNNKLITDAQELPTVAVDLIVLALADETAKTVTLALQMKSSYCAAATWANENRAPVLALDPPPDGTPGVDTKFSLVPFLPLAHSPENGKLYLCNVACPQQVFKDLGIKYTSPFGPKFVIPLHPNDT